MIGSPVAGLVGALLGLAVLIWPRGKGRRLAQALISAGPEPAAARRRRTVRAAWWRRASWGTRLGTAELVTLVDALAPALEAGLPPGRAWELAARSSRLTVGGPVAKLVLQVGEAASRGEPAGLVMMQLAGETKSTQLLLLGTAWRLSEQTGAPLATVARTVARMLRADHAASRRLEAVTTESRTTARILTALPLSGPLFAAVLGLDLRVVATSGPWLWAAFAAGIALAVGGRVWLARLAAAVVRGPTLR